MTSLQEPGLSSRRVRTPIGRFGGSRQPTMPRGKSIGQTRRQIDLGRGNLAQTLNPKSEGV